MIDNTRVTEHKRALFNQACELLGVNPSKVSLVSASDYGRGSVMGLGKYLATVDARRRVMTVSSDAVEFDVYVHELLHILFPRAKHDWIRGVTAVLEGRGSGGVVWGRSYVQPKGELEVLIGRAITRRGLD